MFNQAFQQLLFEIFVHMRHRFYGRDTFRNQVCVCGFVFVCHVMLKLGWNWAYNDVCQKMNNNNNLLSKECDDGNLKRLYLPWILVSLRQYDTQTYLFSYVQWIRWFKAINFQKEWINLEPQANFDLLSCFKWMCLCLLTRLARSFSFDISFKRGKASSFVYRKCCCCSLLFHYDFFFLLKDKYLFIIKKMLTSWLQTLSSTLNNVLMSKKFIHQLLWLLWQPSIQKIWIHRSLPVTLSTFQVQLFRQASNYVWSIK